VTGFLRQLTCCESRIGQCSIARRHRQQPCCFFRACWSRSLTPTHPLTQPIHPPPPPAGTKATELMWELKELFDPDYVLNPGVILNKDPLVRLREMFSMQTGPPVRLLQQERLLGAAGRGCPGFGQRC